MHVCIVADTPGWAFDALAHGIQKYSDLDIDILYQSENLNLLPYDLYYAFSPLQASYLVTKGVDHYITTLHMEPIRTRCNEYLDMNKIDQLRWQGLMGADRVSVINVRQLKAITKTMKELNLCLTEPGYDPDLFFPKPNYRPIDKLKVGWVGNRDKPYKRFDLVEKICDSQFLEFCPIFWKNVRPHNEMRDYYWDIDVLLCMSDHEGLPTTVLEAAACGVPIISTPVGVTEHYTYQGGGIAVIQDVSIVQTMLEGLSQQRIERLGRKAIILGRRFAWPNVIDQWVKFIEGQR